MQALLNLLPVLLCPLMMVVIVWMMRRDMTDDSAATPEVGAVPTQPGGIQEAVRPFWHWLQCCVNWKVGFGLILVGAGIWVVAPGYVGAALPLLLALLCPLSMLLMLWGGRHGRQCAPTTTPTTAAVMSNQVQDSQG